jgi:cytidylate kinase
MKRDYIIAVDGPSGAGKSTVSQKLAEKLGYLYLDTGAMYRAAALWAMRLGLNLDDPNAVRRVAEELDIVLTKTDDHLKVLLGGEDVSREIRGPEMGMAASRISRHLVIREKLWELQRRLAQLGGVVAEGRDVGTMVFPKADFKFYVTASAKERARRRYKELSDKGYEVKLEDIVEEVKKRDEQDSRRELAPLKAADDAIEIDTTSLNVQEAVDLILSHIKK